MNRNINLRDQYLSIQKKFYTYLANQQVHIYKYVQPIIQQQVVSSYTFVQLSIVFSL